MPTLFSLRAIGGLALTNQHACCKHPTLPVLVQGADRYDLGRDALSVER
jgi:hypothetical protein